MDTNAASGFEKFIPGFDFLQNLAKTSAQGLPQMPPLSAWVAPTLKLEEVEKRIEDLKNVQFWLEQNARVLAATIQALEVQKMTLSALKGMNFNMADVNMADFGSMFEARPHSPGAASTAGAAPMSASTASTSTTSASATSTSAASAEPEAKPATAKKASKPRGAGNKASNAGLAVDPVQLWSALSQQFQQIASSAMQSVNTQAAKSKTTGQTAPKSAAKTTTAGKAASAKRPAARKKATAPASKHVRR